MTRAEFMAALSAQLAALPEAERRDALEFYEEYFDAAGPEKEAETLAELGSPEEVARKILEGQGLAPASAGTAAPPERTNRKKTAIIIAVVCFAVLVLLVLAAKHWGLPSKSDSTVGSGSDSTAAATPAPDTVPVDSDSANAYQALLACRTDGYGKLSVKAFNASLLSSGYEVERLMRARSVYEAALSPEYEAYNYFAYTLDYSLLELYYGQQGQEELGFAFALSRQSPEGQTGEYWFNAMCHISYTMPDPDKVTVEERDSALNTLRSEMQAYADSLPEDTLLHSTEGKLKALFNKRAEALTSLLSSDALQLTCEVGGVIRDSTESLVPAEDAEAASQYTLTVPDAADSTVSLPLEQVQTLYLALGTGDVTFVVDDAAEYPTFHFENFDTEAIQFTYGAGNCSIAYHPGLTAEDGGAQQTAPSLTITLPEAALKKLVLKLSSGSANLGRLTVDTLDAALDGGFLEAELLNATDITIGAISSTLTLSGSAEDYRFECEDLATLRVNGGLPEGYEAGTDATRHLTLRDGSAGISFQP